MADLSPEEEFLTELRILCAKYNCSIGGCGCCGSPYVAWDKEVEFEYLHADKERASMKVDVTNYTIEVT